MWPFCLHTYLRVEPPREEKKKKKSRLVVVVVVMASRAESDVL